MSIYVVPFSKYTSQSSNIFSLLQITGFEWNDMLTGEEKGIFVRKNMSIWKHCSFGCKIFHKQQTETLEELTWMRFNGVKLPIMENMKKHNVVKKH